MSLYQIVFTSFGGNFRKMERKHPGKFSKICDTRLFKKLKQDGISKLYDVNAANKKHEIWQRDSLNIETGSRDYAKQKIVYIHFNPDKRNLAKDYLDYYYSSAGFYEAGVDDCFLNNLFHE